MAKRIVELRPTDRFNADGRFYRVVKLTNAVEPTVGEIVSEQAVRDLIRRPDWTVIIKMEMRGD
jgi:hypothetical protein